jgi:hypothetical protein
LSWRFYAGATTGVSIVPGGLRAIVNENTSKKFA